LFTPKTLQKKTKISISVPFVSEPFKFDFSINDAFGLLVSVGHTLWYIQSGKNWIANNIFGVAFCIQGISMISLGGYSVGLILLSGLFFYDIFWVFFTDVMVTVAKSFDAPIKLLFPRDIFAEKFEYAMLGLGDIVIPGIFIALLWRFDVHNRGKKSGSNIYFNVTLLNYVLGLASTMFVMHTFKAAQPALLYLVPFCIISSFLTAVIKGEVKKLFAFTDEPAKKSKGQAKKSQDTKKNEQGGKKEGKKEGKNNNQEKPTLGKQKIQEDKEGKKKNSGETKVVKVATHQSGDIKNKKQRVNPKL